MKKEMIDKRIQENFPELKDTEFPDQKGPLNFDHNG